jgi:hypothetical protein
MAVTRGVFFQFTYSMKHGARGFGHIGHKSHFTFYTLYQSSSQGSPTDDMAVGINKTFPTSTSAAISLNSVKVETFFVEIYIHHAGSFPFKLCSLCLC